ncbi:hypothetical protein [Haloferula sp.]|uniref:hypothetical protein n=1 Tax=Haloferula sp. TaxID=2497595 RepID=UPI0032A07F59
MKFRHIATVAAFLLLCHCAGVESSQNSSTAEGSAPAQVETLKVKAAQGRISIVEDGKAIAFIIPASSNIEETKFINNQEQLVVKSRGSHGPATVQLFNSRSGRQEGKIMAFEIQNDQPEWAAGMGE